MAKMIPKSERALPSTTPLEDRTQCGCRSVGGAGAVGGGVAGALGRDEDGGDQRKVRDDDDGQQLGQDA